MKKLLLVVLSLVLLFSVSTALAEIRLTQVEGGMDGDVMELCNGNFVMQIEGSEVGELYRVKLTGPSTYEEDMRQTIPTMDPEMAEYFEYLLEEEDLSYFVVQDAFFGGEPYLLRAHILSKAGELGPLTLTVTGGGETVTREYTVRAFDDAQYGSMGRALANDDHQDTPLLVPLDPGVAPQEQYGIKVPGDGAVYSGLNEGRLEVIYHVPGEIESLELWNLETNRWFFRASGGGSNKEVKSDYHISDFSIRYDTPFEVRITTKNPDNVYKAAFTIKREDSDAEVVEVEPVETLRTTRARIYVRKNGRVTVDEKFYDDVVAFMDAHLPRKVTGVNKGKWGDYYFGYDNDRDKKLHHGSIMVAYPEGADPSTYYKFTDQVLDEMASLRTYTNQKFQSKYKNKPLSTAISGKSPKIDNTLTSSGFEAIKGEYKVRLQPFGMVKTEGWVDGQMYIYVSLQGKLPSGFMSDCRDITWVCSKPEEVKALMDIMLEAAPNCSLDTAVMDWYNSHLDVDQPVAKDATTEPADASKTEAPKDQAAADSSSKVKILKGCNIRSTPSGSGTKLGYAMPDETYVCLGVEDNGWYHIVLTDGQEGYIAGSFAKEIE